ncbi:hypothetical protein ACJ72_05916 [Emergomyces africanus]|uniref:HNH nuclease domain-containing protein n=1 Tax=Emergomyces africanus TaxID=1955775 RepID=A0A1B7NSJ2_9EURO|nr:hypothetical protein ACJ72_05916 [Emergomyces africanus]
MRQIASWTNPVDELEVSHILPSALMESDKNSGLDDSKETTLAIQDMFDSGSFMPNLGCLR